MYAPTYGFGQAPPNNNAQQAAGFNPNVPSAAQPSSFFPGQQPQQQQQIMYNSQQYGAGPQQNPYAAMGVNPAMMQGGGAMAHMSINNAGVQGYQTPYASSPYNTGMPTSTGPPPMQQQYMTPTSNNTQFAMNVSGMNPQQQQQRMQPPSVSTPISSSQRVSPYGGAPQNTPPQVQNQSQFMTPQNPASSQPQQAQTPLQTQNNNATQQQQQQQQQQGQNTPQTPNFPPNSAGAAAPTTTLPTPLSPASETREKERVSLLLDINRELLMEVMRLQAVQAEAKKENASPKTETQSGDSKPLEKPSPAVTGKEFVECMRRLQANLAYLAAIADRSHKPSSAIPPHPAIISAPQLSPLPPKTQTKPSPKASPNQNTNVKTEQSSETANSAANGTATAVDSEGTEDRLEILKALYAQLQALFPGVDPKKEPPIQAMSKNAQQKAQVQRQNINQAQNQLAGQGQAVKAQPQGQMIASSMMPQTTNAG